MTDKLPKDLAAAKRGYEAFYDEQPNIWFEDLAYNYQMRWVRAARAIMDEHKRYKGPGRPNGMIKADENHPALNRNDQFWKDLGSLPAEEFISKHVPKHPNGRNNFQALTDAKRKAALRAHKKMYNKAYGAKKK